jgi:REP element-mobilizing transposase RayT
VQFAGAFYHVIARGNRRQEIFHEDGDYAAYLERLERYRRRDGGTLYAYVLMANHVHLLIETTAVPLSRTMQTLQFTYTQYYNRCYGKTGHLFQGRYKAILCDREAYVLELVRYIHLNPARLRHRLDPWRYRWSSHRAYLGEPGPVQVSTGMVLSQFGCRQGTARAAYLQFLKDGRGLGHQEKFYDAVNQQVLGDDSFVQTVEDRTSKAQVRDASLPRIAFTPLLSAVARLYDLTPETLIQSGRQRALMTPRAFLVYVAREWSGLPTGELAHRLHRDASMVSRLYARYAAQRDLQAERRLLALVQR